MMMISRRDALAFGAGLSALGLAGAPALAQQRFFRIGTGGTGGTYYPVGGMIANAISTPTINVSAVATNGSVANVNGIVGGSMESGFSQADINAWAYTGTGIYEGKPKIEELRVIANLYPESVHVVVKKGAGYQVARGPQGQARLDRRAGLRHAGQCARAARRLRRERARHQAGVSQAGAVAPRSSRTARSTAISRPPAIRRARSPNSPPPTASSCSRSTASSATRSWRSTSSSRRTRSRTAPTRT